MRSLFSMLSLTCFGFAAGAQPPPASPMPGGPNEAAKEALPAVKLTLRPAAAPRQSLRYQLLPELKDKKPGNALTLYYRAFSPEWWGEISRDKEFYQKSDKWLKMPLEELKKSDAKWILQFRALQEVDRGARRQFCDWELADRLREEGIGLLLPDLQSMRTFAMLLSIRSRLELADGKFDDAVRSLQTGFALGKHCGEGPTLIHSLVGIAIGHVMLARLEELIQQPGAPNLYWGLTALPRGLVDMRHPIQGEMVWWLSYVPDIKELEKGPMTQPEAQVMLDRLIKKLGQIDPNISENRTIFPSNPLAQRLVWAAFISVNYPRSKSRLVATGMAADLVERMPALQVVVLDTLREFLRLQEEGFKAFYLPYHEGAPIFAKARAEIQAARTNEQGNLFLQALCMLLPAVEKVHFASVRTERKIDALRCIEAIRLHAASHQGDLPKSLDDITEVPVPKDVVTGKHFDYLVSGNVIKLYGPPPAKEPAHQGNTIIYELTFKK